MNVRLPLSVVLIVVALAVTSGVHAQPAPPDPPEKARARVLLKEGVRLLNAGQFAPALRKFEDAYAAFPSAKILVNIGTAQSGLGRSGDAANTYQRYLDLAGEDAAQLPAVRAALADLDAKLGRLAMKLRGPAAVAGEIRVASGAWMPLSPSNIVRVAPGRFELQARASAGAREYSTSGTIAAGEQKELAIDLSPPEPADARPETRAATPDTIPPGASPAGAGSAGAMSASRPRAPDAALDTLPASFGAQRFSVARSPESAGRWTPLRYGAVAAGAAGVAGVGAMAVLALRARSMWSDAQARTDSKLASRAATQANLATGAGVVGVAALAAGTVLWFVGAPRDRESKAITAVVGRSHVGVAVTGRF